MADAMKICVGFVEESQVRNLALTLDGVPFTYAEIESCVALDEANRRAAIPRLRTLLAGL